MYWSDCISCPPPSDQYDEEECKQNNREDDVKRRGSGLRGAQLLRCDISLNHGTQPGTERHTRLFFVFFFLDKLDWDLPTSSEQGCKTQGSQRLSLHSFEQCPLPPASPTTLVTRVTFWMWYVSLPSSKRLQSWVKRRLEWPSYVQGHRDNLLPPWTRSPCTELVAQLDDHPDNKEHLAHRPTLFRSHISILVLISLSYLLFMYVLKIKVSKQALWN